MISLYLDAIDFILGLPSSTGSLSPLTYGIKINVEALRSKLLFGSPKMTRTQLSRLDRDDGMLARSDFGHPHSPLTASPLPVNAGIHSCYANLAHLLLRRRIRRENHRRLRGSSGIFGSLCHLLPLHSYHRQAQRMRGYLLYLLVLKPGVP